MAEVDGVAGGGEAMVELEAAAEAARRAATEWAGRLSVERRRGARDLSRALVAELEALALTGARFEARFAESEGRALGPEGWDEVEFFLSTNPGAELGRMLGGERLTHEVREHAEQLLRRAQRPQPGIDSQQRGRVAG